MHEHVPARATRVLVVGTPPENQNMSPESVLASDGTVIFMEIDAARAAEMRRKFSNDGVGDRAAVIGGDPRRMLYKLAGPFDVIFCSTAHLSTLPMLEKLLAPDGVLITHGGA
jgi:predicted O-methyltransferase YrrM